MSSSQSRRFFQIALACAVAACALPAIAQQKIQIRFSAASPPADFLSKSMEVFKADLEKAAPEFDVSLFPASKLVRQGAELPALQRGNIELFTMTAFEVAGQIPEYGFFNRAYLFRDYDHMMKVFKGPIGEEFAKAVWEKMGVQILAPTYLGTRQVNLRSARDVKGPQNLSGVKMRMPATPEWLLLGQTLGVNPVPLAMPEVYLALQTGSIDGQENPLTIMRAAKFNEVTKQVVLTAHLVQPVFYTVGKHVWDKVTPDQKRKLIAAANSATKMNDEARLADEKQVEQILTQQGLSVSRIDLGSFRANADKIYASADLAKPWDRKMMDRVTATK